MKPSKGGEVSSITGQACRGSVYVASLLVTLLGLFPADKGRGQGSPKSSSDLIKYLTYQSGRSDTHGLRKGIFSCGASIEEYREDRPVAEALVKMGGSAIPDLEAALDSIEARGGQSEFAFNSEWLLDAYARIRGPAAGPRLRRMLSNPRLAFFRAELDHAVALSLGITSYVSDSGELGEMVTCSRVLEPKSLLDQLVLAWERDDRQWVEASLGPSAKDALRRLLDGKTWQVMRAELWGGKSNPGVAVGYRFVTRGWWSVTPEGPFEVKLYERRPANPDINTLFSNTAGRECGSYRVKFLLTEEYYFKYLVDNPDLRGLLRVIAACADESERAN